jgi:hypothetical protein
MGGEEETEICQLSHNPAEDLTVRGEMIKRTGTIGEQVSGQAGNRGEAGDGPGGSTEK